MHYYTFTTRPLRSLPSVKPSAPRDMTLSVSMIFYQIITLSPDRACFDLIQRLLYLSRKSIQKPATLASIQSLLARIQLDDFDRFIHLLHLTLYVESLESTPHAATLGGSLTPIKDAMSALLSHADVKTALSLFPNHLIDVLTAHPVDMDRGLVVELKRELDEFNRLWEMKKESYQALSTPSAQQTARTELDELNQQIRNTITMLLSTPNYRESRIKPESEQRNLSRAIKIYEPKISAHWSKIVEFVQESFLEAMAAELIAKAPNAHPLSALLAQPRSPEKFQALLNAPDLIEHPCYADVLNLKTQIQYTLEVWRGDMDGNPYVTGKTMAKSTAYGRVRCFEDLTADEAVIRYRPQTESFKSLENVMTRTLSQLKEKGSDAWKRYIQDRVSEEWGPAQIYSGLTYYRLVEMTEAAEHYLRQDGEIGQLRTGFADNEAFLSFTTVLQHAEECAGIENGTWTKLRKLVKLRDMSLGLPHARKGESFHLTLISESLSILFPKRFVHAQAFSNRSIGDQKQYLKRFVQKEIALPLDFEIHLTPESRALFGHYALLMEIRHNATLIQSDSGSATQDIELSILIMKALSKLLSHTGRVVILCEDKDSMLSAISLMKNTPKSSDLFDRVIMMCAGSDNQKKLGPFYAATLNHDFLMTAYRNGITSFFGVGDSPLRSACHDPICSFKTFQPGSRKRYFFGGMIYTYLSYRLANQIQQIAYYHTLSPKLSSLHETLCTHLGESFYTAYQNHIHAHIPLQQAIQSIAEIVTTYFSRPSKKYTSQGFSLDLIRAIDSGRAQLILNTFEPQVAGLPEGLTLFLSRCKASGISKKNIHAFFNHTPLGQGILKTLAFYAAHLDDVLDDPLKLRLVSSQTLSDCYFSLSGKRLKVSQDPHLRLSRLVWQHAEFLNRRHGLVDKNQDLRPIAMLLFGANWMI